MKVAYIAHPISGDIEGNLKKIEAIGRQINLEEKDTVPFAPYFFDCYCLDDDNPKERARGIKNDIALMKKGFVDEVRLYGHKISTGMGHEVDLAMELKIPVVPMTEATDKELRERWPEWGICNVSNCCKEETIQQFFEKNGVKNCSIPDVVFSEERAELPDNDIKGFAKYVLCLANRVCEKRSRPITEEQGEQLLKDLWLNYKYDVDVPKGN